MKHDAPDLTGGETALLMVFGIFWIWLIWRLWGDPRRTRRFLAVPLIAFPIVYAWLTTIRPMVDFAEMLRIERRRQRFARFFKLADDLRMRRKSPNQLVPSGTGGRGRAGEGDISG